MKRFMQISVAILVMSLGHSTASFAEPIKLKFAFMTDERERTWTTTIKPFIDAVNKDGKGIIEIDAYPNGALGRNIPQQAQLVLDGVADLAFVIPGATPGRFPENEVMELPGITTDVKDATRVYDKMLREGKIRGFEDFYVVAALGGDSFPLNMRPAVSTLADIRGKKVRVGGGMQTRTMKALGVVPVLIPINEAAEAISRGTIDGVAIQVLPMIDYGVSRVVNNHYLAGVGFTPLTILMNRKVFERLPPNAKAVIEKYSGDWITDLYAREFTKASVEALNGLRADPKRKVVTPNEADRRELDASYRTVVAEWAAQSPRLTELYKDLTAASAQVRATK